MIYAPCWSCEVATALFFLPLLSAQAYFGRQFGFEVNDQWVCIFFSLIWLSCLICWHHLMGLFFRNSNQNTTQLNMSKNSRLSTRISCSMIWENQCQCFVVQEILWTLAIPLKVSQLKPLLIYKTLFFRNRWLVCLKLCNGKSWWVVSCSLWFVKCCGESCGSAHLCVDSLCFYCICLAFTDFMSNLRSTAICLLSL